MLSGKGRFRTLIYGGAFASVLITAIACGSSEGDPTSTPGASPSASAATSTATETSVPVPDATASPVGTSVSSTVTRPTPTATVFVPPATPTPAFGRELLEFGGFERTIFDHWQPRLIAGQLIETVTDVKLSGDRSLRMVTSSDEKDWPRVVLRERFPTEAGASYRLQYNVIQTAQGPVEIFLDFYDGSGEFINRRVFSEWLDTEGDWAQIGRAEEAPPGAATALVTVQLRIRTDDPSLQLDELEVWVDDVSVRKAVE